MHSDRTLEALDVDIAELRDELHELAATVNGLLTAARVLIVLMGGNMTGHALGVL